MKSYFELFQLPVQFGIDQSELKKKYITLSREYHPDFHTLATESEQEQMLELSTQINEAYKTLSNADQLTAYVLELHGVDLSSGNSVPQDFLMQMMDINEQLMELQMDEENTTLREQVQGSISNVTSEIKQKMDELKRLYDRSEGDKNDIVSELKDLYLKERYVKRLLK